MTPAQSKIKQWRERPVSFVREVLRAEPDPWQSQALEAFSDPQKKRISLQACAGPGKSAVLAWFGLNFLLCYGTIGQHPNGAVMSVTADNLKDNLWKELAVWHGRSEILQKAFAWTKERIFARDDPNTWFLSARSWSKKANAEEQGRTLSGLHSEYILYLIDESGDISAPVLRSAEQGLARCKWGKIAQAGNPTSHDGILYLASVSQRHMWELIRITGDPDDPDRSTRIGIDWAREQIKLYGRENPWVMAYILGQFPPSAINTLLSVEDMEAAMKRHLTEDKYNFAQKRLGIDAAGDGLDPWVIWPRQGLANFMPVEMRNPKSHEVAARVAQAKAKWGSEMEFYDDTGGWAKGAIDAATLSGQSPVGINFGGKANDPRFFNKRAEMAFTFAELVKERGAALPNIPHIIREFVTPTYWFDKGKFYLEEKPQIKKRLGHSTNYFDAAMLTCAYPDMPASGSFEKLIEDLGKKSSKDWDPYAPERM